MPAIIEPPDMTVAHPQNPGPDSSSASTAVSRLLTAVDRATAELRRGGIVWLTAKDGGDILVAAAETSDEAVVAYLAAASREPPMLLLTAARAATIGLSPAGAEIVCLPLPANIPAETIWRLADPLAAGPIPPVVGGPGPALPKAQAGAAIELMKLARLLPAAIVARSDLRAGRDRQDLLAVGVSTVNAYQLQSAHSLRIVGDARVPLAGAEDARIVAFRPGDGGEEHLAIVVGDPPVDGPVLARLHSECFTGDILGSLRCDCGDQLRGAITEIGRRGAGILLYLAQEGRGIGLVNKLRAYRLQDSGADTAEANQQLGFEADERVYLPAAEMLRLLGYRSVRLMTNNPAKVEGLSRCGIDVVERVPLVVPATSHSERYLGAKAAKLGHLF